MKVAAINWKLRPIQNEREFVEHAFEILEKCHQQRAELALFPECFTLELLHLHPDVPASEIGSTLNPQLLDPIIAKANSAGMVLVAGSTFYPHQNGFQNASAAFWHDGKSKVQPKMVLTQYELNDWKLEPGESLISMPDPRFGIAICYDSEFPENGRAQSEAGVQCLCVPAFTQDNHGFHRVRLSCHARAIENQIFVIHSSLVGSLGREPVPTAVGSSAIIAPSIEPFPANGILAETPYDEESIAVVELNFESLNQARESGDVRNWNDRHRVNWTYE